MSLFNPQTAKTLADAARAAGRAMEWRAWYTADEFFRDQPFQGAVTTFLALCSPAKIMDMANQRENPPEQATVREAHRKVDVLALALHDSVTRLHMAATDLAGLERDAGKALESAGLLSLSTERVRERLKIPEDVIDALERCDHFFSVPSGPGKDLLLQEAASAVHTVMVRLRGQS